MYSGQMKAKHMPKSEFQQNSKNVYPKIEVPGDMTMDPQIKQKAHWILGRVLGIQSKQNLIVSNRLQEL